MCLNSYVNSMCLCAVFTLADYFRGKSRTNFKKCVRACVCVCERERERVKISVL